MYHFILCVPYPHTDLHRHGYTFHSVRSSKLHWITYNDSFGFPSLCCARWLLLLLAGCSIRVSLCVVVCRSGSPCCAYSAHTDAKGRLTTFSPETQVTHDDEPPIERRVCIYKYKAVWHTRTQTWTAGGEKKEPTEREWNIIVIVVAIAYEAKMYLHNGIFSVFWYLNARPFGVQNCRGAFASQALYTQMCTHTNARHAGHGLTTIYRR